MVGGDAEGSHIQSRSTAAVRLVQHVGAQFQVEPTRTLDPHQIGIAKSMLITSQKQAFRDVGHARVTVGIVEVDIVGTRLGQATRASDVGPDMRIVSTLIDDDRLTRAEVEVTTGNELTAARSRPGDVATE